MADLTNAETSGLYELIVAEHQAKRAAADSLEDFASVAVFKHLTESADRHIASLCKALHSSGAKAPLLAPVLPAHHPTVVDALEAAAEREAEMAASYHELLKSTTNGDLKRVLLPLWQSVCHLHLTAIEDRLTIERGTAS